MIRPLLSLRDVELEGFGELPYAEGDGNMAGTWPDVERIGLRCRL
jgi:hypothetical protein